MPREEVQRGLDFIKWLSTHNSEPAVIGLTGGEPTLHPDFWTFLMPQLVELKKQYPKVGIELHTNASRPISKENIAKFHKFFANCFVGHDMFHREFRPLNKLFLEDYCEVCHGGVTLRSNNWMLRGLGRADVPVACVRIKGRAEGLLKHEKYCELQVPSYPRQDCTWHQFECTVVNFTPGLINHCGEKSHPLPDGSDMNDFSKYTDSFDKVLDDAIRYQLTRCGKNCSQKCLVSCIARKADAL